MSEPTKADLEAQITSLEEKLAKCKEQRDEARTDANAKQEQIDTLTKQVASRQAKLQALVGNLQSMSSILQIPGD